ncbi:sensor histidine kinase [Nocardia sp. CDC186]|uniref:Sensor histidine kinase n=1 Tax=Nocardia implantans TaxID=3108168 RepID=A0ABU6AXS9_9NOCA|nr:MULTISPECIES: sensor histidine kinase [unclassified Nocardia]MBF6190712.1 sensor histidine kinase [Nocardia beijingensis]MEA3528624.1 sensor histidine kinase [Nocardia sp. CDC192]MEB3512224.1 sensor histidine kinase [Nocardia sp. CDC186]
MHSSPLTPVFTTLRLGLHVLMTGLAAVVGVRAVLPGAAHPAATVSLAAAFLATYFAGAAFAGERRAIPAWLGALTALWLGLVVLAPDAGYLAFGLFFLYLHLLPRVWNLCAVAAATAVAVVGFGLHRGWSAAGVVGPVIGAAVAVGIGLGYQALFREAADRQRLIDELLSTRAVLAERERTAGKLAERERLAAEIHDTVAQGLSSIQLLLHAVEQEAPDHPALRRIRLAREAAAENLAETRRLVAELAPVALDGQSLADALERITQRAAPPGLDARFAVEGRPERLPMPIEAALVRIAQGAVSNVVRHAGASRMRVTLTYAHDAIHLDVVDDGVGIAPELLERSASGSFGLAAMRSRVHEQGGAMAVESEPGHTAVTVSFPLDTVPAGERGAVPPGLAQPPRTEPAAWTESAAPNPGGPVSGNHGRSESAADQGRPDTQPRDLGTEEQE